MKKPDMQAALRVAAAEPVRKPVLTVVQESPIAEQPRRRGRPTSRADKFPLTVWVPNAVVSSIRLIQAQQPKKTQQDLTLEAFNELFRRYNVPTINEE